MKIVTNNILNQGGFFYMFSLFWDFFFPLCFVACFLGLGGDKKSNNMPKTVPRIIKKCENVSTSLTENVYLLTVLCVVVGLGFAASSR